MQENPAQQKKPDSTKFFILKNVFFKKNSRNLFCLCLELEELEQRPNHHSRWVENWVREGTRKDRHLSEEEKQRDAESGSWRIWDNREM